MGMTLSFTNDKIAEVLGEETLTRLQHVFVGNLTIENYKKDHPIYGEQVGHAFNVIANANTHDMFLGQELVGMLVHRDPEEYRDDPAPAFFLAADLLKHFHVLSNAQVAGSIVHASMERPEAKSTLNALSQE